MKKILFILMMILLINPVKANEYQDITEDIEIRYKWYKEVVEGDYYPIKEKQPDYLIDYTKLKYGNYSIWKNSYCDFSNENYLKESKTIRDYKKVRDTRYIKLENFSFKNNIKIYQNNKLLDYKIISDDGSTVKIDLKKNYRSETIILNIENAQNYKITFYVDENFTKLVISKDVVNETLLIPDKTWITENTNYDRIFVEGIYDDNDLIWKMNEYDLCRVSEIYVYKYQIKKEYYDDNYHKNVDGYIKDENDYKVFYKGEPITNTIEIIQEKIVKEPQIEYIYIEKENEKNDSSKEIQENLEIDKPTKKDCLPEIQTEIIEKEILKIPKKIYIIISVLLLIIILLITKLYKKYVG